MLQDVASNLELRNPEIQISILRDRRRRWASAAADRDGALQRVRRAPGQHALRRDRPVLGAARARPALPARHQCAGSLFVQSRAAGRWCRSARWREIKMRRGPDFGASLRTAAVGHAVLQPRAGRLGRRRGRRTCRSSPTRSLPRGVSATFAGSAKAFQEAFRTLPMLLLVTITPHLHDARDTLRALRASVHDSDGAAVRGFRRAADAAALRRRSSTSSASSGIILLIGLVKKNGIMMVDFALQMQREQRLPPAEAIVEACLVRFRPIMMTTMAAIFATLPIALGYGAGAETRSRSVSPWWAGWCSRSS